MPLMSRKNFLVCLLTQILFTSVGYTQTINTDSLQIGKAHNWSVSKFNEAVGAQSRLFNGPSYAFYPFNSEVSAYFNDLRTFERGTVVYDSYTYENIPLLYDLYKDIVVSMLPDGYSKYSLLGERVSDFYQDGHHFIRIGSDSVAAKHPINAGFYDLIYDKKVKILVKRYKTIKETIDSREYKKYFVPGEDYYLLKDQVYYKVNTERAFLSLFQNRKEMQRYLKTKNIKYRKTPELALLTLAGYYDSLSN